MLGRRGRIRPLRRRRAVTLAIVVISAGLAVHHSSIAVDAHAHDKMPAAAELCLGVLTAVGAVAAFGLVPFRRRSPATFGPLGLILPSPTPEPRARAGLLLLPLLCVLRR